MKVVKLSQVKPYAAPKHFNMTAMRLQGKDETGIQKFWVGLSYFLPAAEQNGLMKILLMKRYIWFWTVKLPLRPRRGNKAGSYGFALSGPNEGR